MGGINTGRVIIGGLVAGLVINVSEAALNMGVLGTDMAAAMTKLNLPMITNQTIAAFVVLGFLVGIVTVWLYAAARPRLGPGPKTASRIGALVWFLAYFYGGVGMTVMGIFPIRMMAISVAWGLAEMLIAANAGAYFYKE